MNLILISLVWAKTMFDGKSKIKIRERNLRCFFICGGIKPNNDGKAKMQYHSERKNMISFLQNLIYNSLFHSLLHIHLCQKQSLGLIYIPGQCQFRIFPL